MPSAIEHTGLRSSGKSAAKNRHEPQRFAGEILDVAEDGTVVGTPNHRNSVIDAISRSTEDYQQFGEMTDDPETYAEFSRVADTTAEEGEVIPGTEGMLPDGEEEPAEVKADAEGKKPVADEFVTVKVDGVEERVARADVDEAGGIAPYQKNRAADKRLQEATRILQEATALRGSRPSPDGDAGERGQEEHPTGDGGSQDLDAQALAQAIRMGSDEEAVEAVKRLTSARSVTTETVDAQVQVAIESREIQRKLKEEFSDILDDPRMARIFVEEDVDRFNKGDRRPVLERARDIAKELRAWRGTPDPTASRKAATDAESRQDKVARKANVSSIRPASVRAPAPEEPDIEQSIEQDRRDYLAQMQRVRGGAFRN